MSPLLVAKPKVSTMNIKRHQVARSYHLRSHACSEHVTPKIINCHRYELYATRADGGFFLESSKLVVDPRPICIRLGHARVQPLLRSTRCTSLRELTNGIPNRR